ATRGSSNGSDGDPIANNGNKLPGGKIATVKQIDRAAKNGGAGLERKVGNDWRPVRADDQLDAGTELRTDERTRAAIELADDPRSPHTQHRQAASPPADAGKGRRPAGRVAADAAHNTKTNPAVIDTPSGRVDVVGTKFALTATPKLTVVQVVRGEVILT